MSFVRQIVTEEIFNQATTTEHFCFTVQSTHMRIGRYCCPSVTLLASGHIGLHIEIIGKSFHGLMGQLCPYLSS